MIRLYRLLVISLLVLCITAPASGHESHGFASGLSTTGMSTAELLWALLSFNMGVELGQLAFVFLALERVNRDLRYLHSYCPDHLLGVVFGLILPLYTLFVTQPGLKQGVGFDPATRIQTYWQIPLRSGG